MIGFLFKFLLVIVVFGAIGLVGYAYFADMTPSQTDIIQEIELSIE